MKFDMNNINLSAQNAVEQQINNDAIRTGQEISEKLKRMLEYTTAFSIEVQKAVDKIKDDTQTMLGDEKSIIEINNKLQLESEKINGSIDTFLMNNSQLMSEMMTVLTAIDNRLVSMENRKIGTQIKDEVKDNVSQIINSTRSAVQTVYHKVNDFLNNLRDSVNKAISNIKEKAFSLSQAWSAYKDAVSSNVRSYSDALTLSAKNSFIEIKKGNKPLTREQFSNKKFIKIEQLYLSADKGIELKKLEEKYKNAKGLDKLIYKAAIISTASTLEKIDKIEENTQKIEGLVNRYRDESQKREQAMVQKITDTKESINMCVLTAKNEISTATKELKSNAVLKVIAVLEKACTKAYSYADKNNIELSNSTKAHNEQEKETDFEYEN